MSMPYARYVFLLALFRGGSNNKHGVRDLSENLVIFGLVYICKLVCLFSKTLLYCLLLFTLENLSCQGLLHNFINQKMKFSTNIR